MSEKNGRNNSWQYQDTDDSVIPMDIENCINILDTTYFNDGIRSIDYILVWIKSHIALTNESDNARRSYRKKYEENLKKRGLILETSIKDLDTDSYYFVKVCILNI